MLYGTLYAANNYGPAAPLANEQERRTFDALPQANRAALNGKVVEVHVIPQNRKLTDLLPD